MAGEEALVQVRPILDAEIDDAAKAVQENQSAQEALSDRIGQIEPEVRAAKAVRDRMRNDQAVITFDEVLLARQRRDQGWERVRNTFMASVEDAVDAEATGSAVDEALPEAYERAVREADERADGYARDTQAAAELKAKDEEIARYERDLQTLTSQLTQLQGTGQALSATWGTRLAKCARELDALAPVMDTARAEAERTRRELEAIDASSEAAEAQDALCQTSAVIERDLRPWIQLRLAHRLLMEAQRRFQERAQGPMLERASSYFRRMTDDAFAGLRSDTLDERQVLVAQRADGNMIGTEAMSEGTLDQLYLALRLAAVSLRRDAGVNLPMVLDDVLMTSSDGRAGCVLQALGEFSRDGQVIVFTHHEHLLEVARRHVPEDLLQVTTL